MDKGGKRISLPVYRELQMDASLNLPDVYLNYERTGKYLQRSRISVSSSCLGRHL